MVTAVLLSGCSGVKTSAQSGSAPPGVFVDYQRNGGVAGFNDRLVIFDNGVTLISGRMVNTEGRLNQTDLERIGSIFAESKFSSLEGNYTSRHDGVDIIQYTISFGGKTVHTEDTAIPPALQPIIEEMDRILSLGTNSGQSGSPLSRFTRQ